MSTVPRSRVGIKPLSDERASASSVGSPLGIHARFASTASQSHAAEALCTRFALQSAARELLRGERVCTCLRAPVPGQLINVLYSPAQQKAHYGGLQVCASVWACAVCAAKISERRRVELSEALRAWLDLGGSRRTLLVTFTLSHTLGDDIARVLGLLKAARRHLMSGRAANAFKQRYNVFGSVRALEVTHGSNGFHPHLHVLYFFNEEVPIIPFTEDMKARWVASVGAAGGSASLEHGCDVRFSDVDVANYVAKFGRASTWTAAHELTKTPVKRGRSGGRTPSELLHDYQFNDDKQAGALWQVYARCFKGEHQLYWSPGLRAALGLQMEKSDEEVATEQDEIAVVLAGLSPAAWRVVAANDARAELLLVAGSGDASQVQAFLARLGVVSRESEVL